MRIHQKCTVIDVFIWSFWKDVILINTLSRSHLLLNPAEVTLSSCELQNLGFVSYLSKLSTHLLGLCILRTELFQYALNKMFNHTNEWMKQKELNWLAFVGMCWFLSRNCLSGRLDVMLLWVTAQVTLFSWSAWYWYAISSMCPISKQMCHEV